MRRTLFMKYLRRKRGNTMNETPDELQGGEGPKPPEQEEGTPAEGPPTPAEPPDDEPDDNTTDDDEEP